MEQRQMKILWIDDDISRFKLQPYIDEFEDNGFEIIKVSNPDDVEENIAGNDDIRCVILDISMPTGKKVSSELAKRGMRTGLLILKKLQEDPMLEFIKKVVFTIVTDDEVRRYCQEHGIHHFKKQEYVADTFIEKIKKIIGESRYDG